VFEEVQLEITLTVVLIPKGLELLKAMRNPIQSLDFQMK
jgi:hypothetical protein